MGTLPKILLFGKNGQVGWELQRALAPLGPVVALDRHGSEGLCGDLADLEGIAATIRAVAPNVIVNAAAYTGVDQAQAEPELARRINCDAVAVLAREAQALGAWLVSYSTDYVFDGSGQQPWREEDVPHPLSVYGQTKRDGELAIQAVGGQHLIFRTSWVYGARGRNFAKTILRLAAERDALQVVADQFGAPTGADLLADVTAHALRLVRLHPELAGLYHLAAAGETSWHGYARHVVEAARAAGHPLRLAGAAIVPVPATAYPLPAPRQANSRLDTSRVRAAFGVHLPPWQEGVDRLLGELFEERL